MLSSDSSALHVLRKQAVWTHLRFYQKTEVLYQMTVVFCKRFLPAHGDRTVDQMVQAARSGKQNIVEGCSAGCTSTETEFRLLNVARASVLELQEDFVDYLKAHHTGVWDRQHDRYDGMLTFCRAHNELPEYEQFFWQWSDEEMANVGYSLCRMVDKMMTSYLQQLEQLFTEQGGIKERMTAVRLDARQEQTEQIAALRKENEALQQQLAALQKENEMLKQTLAILQQK